MTSCITKQIPDFPYKEHVLPGAWLGLDWVEYLNPEHAVSLIWRQFKDKWDVVDDLRVPLSLKKKVVKLQDKYKEWNSELFKTFLELACAGADCVKVAITTIKAVDRYAVSILPPIAAALLNSVAAGAGLAASTARVGINSYELYENCDVHVTGESALFKAASRFLVSIYGLIASIIMAVSLIVNISMAPLIILALFTWIYATEVSTAVWLNA